MSLMKIDFPKNKEYLLSVVIPVYNPQKYLCSCLDSVINQTFDNFELIVINDASSDNSFDIINQYAKEDSRIRFINNSEHRGAAYSRNLGLEKSTGKYVIFLDADDFFEIDFFEKMLLAIDSSDADIAVCCFYWRDERYGYDLPVPLNLDKLSQIFCEPFSPSDFNCKVFYDLPFAPFNKLIRRSLLIEKKIYFQDLTNCNDVFFGIMSIAESNRIVFVPKPFIHYRYNTGCQISTNRSKNPLCICFAFQKVREDFIARDLWKAYRQMYYDKAVSSIFDQAWSSYEPSALLEYLRGDGLQKLGLDKLQLRDFSSFKLYGQYRFLFFSKFTKFRGLPNISKCALTALFKLEFAVAFLLYKQIVTILISRYRKILSKIK